MPITAQTFLRPALAQRVVDLVLAPRNNSGLFLSAPRRTGKSTFIREDVRPLLRSAGVIVIYVDLWSDPTIDPANLISTAIRDAIGKTDGIVAQVAKKVGLEKISLGGLVLNLEKVGIGTGETLTRALTALSDETKKMIVLIVDEAQQAQTTVAGLAAMEALKAARDELNSSEHYGFRLIATGSNRDRLHAMTTNSKAAFYKASTMELEPLGADYIRWEAGLHPTLPRPADAILTRVFDQCQCRPEDFLSVFSHLETRQASAGDVTAENIDRLFEAAQEEVRQNTKEAFRQDYLQLTSLQAAVLAVLAWQGSEFSPFVDSTYRLVALLMASRSKEEAVNVNASRIDSALEALRNKTPHYVWKTGRGSYALDDEDLRDWTIEISGITSIATPSEEESDLPQIGLPAPR